MEHRVFEKEMAEYRILCATVSALHEKFLKRKDELRLLLEETEALRRDTLLVLAKANRLTRHLTGGQRQITGIAYHLSEINARIEKINQSNPVFFQNPDTANGGHSAEVQEHYHSREELKQKELAVLGMIDSLKARLLQLDLLELRYRELMLSINKVIDAFRRESRIIRRNIYPFGIFSLFSRALRVIRGKTYFTFRDLEDITALGNSTCNVLRIADSPV